MNLADFASQISNRVRSRFFSNEILYYRGDRSTKISASIESPGSVSIAAAGFTLFQNSAIFVATVVETSVDGVFVAPQEGDEICFVDERFGPRRFVVGPDAGGSCWNYRPDDPAMQTILIHTREKRDYREFQ